MRLALLAPACLLLAGCFSEGGGAGAGNTEPARGESFGQQQLAEDPALPGVFLQAQAFGEGLDYTLEAILSNDGNQAYGIHTACGELLTEGMRLNGTLVAHRAPRDCDASVSELAPGAVEHPTLHWNGTLWQSHTRAQAEATGQEGTFVPAPAGLYEWTVGATFLPNGDGADTTLRLTFAIRFS